MDVKLGKQPHKKDDRTVLMANFLSVPTGIVVPEEYDFDRHRKAFPFDQGWGNFDYGDCVLAGRANQLLRLERIETRRTVPITAQMVIDKYKAMTGCVSPGDNNDTGLVVLDALSDWRHGWDLPVYRGRTFSISAYGLLRARDHEQLRAASFLLDGVQLGINLPLSAQAQLNAGQAWDVDNTPQGEPGTWGGHLVYAKHYDEHGFYCITWDREQYMTNAFIDKYVDEAWAVVDALNAHSRYLDVARLTQYLRDIGATQIN